MLCVKRVAFASIRDKLDNEKQPVDPQMAKLVHVSDRFPIAIVNRGEFQTQQYEPEAAWSRDAATGLRNPWLFEPISGWLVGRVLIIQFRFCLRVAFSRANSEPGSQQATPWNCGIKLSRQADDCDDVFVSEFQTTPKYNPNFLSTSSPLGHTQLDVVLPSEFLGNPTSLARQVLLILVVKL